MQEEAMQETYTTKQVADMIGVNASRVRQLAIASEGTIGRKWGRDWMFTAADVQALRNRADLRQRDTRRGPKQEGRAE